MASSDLSLDLEARLLECFTPGTLAPDFGVEWLSAFVKRDVELSAADRQRYALEADLKLNGSNYGLHFKAKYFDATFNFCLTHGGELVATLGFEVEGSAMNIWQLQGVRGCTAALAPIKWERALVTYALDWASRWGVTDVFIVSAERNEWTHGEGHLDRRRGRLRYDVTAKRCGFRATGDGYYHRPLPTSA